MEIKVIVSVNQNVDKMSATDKYRAIFARAYQALEKYGNDHNTNYLRVTHEDKAFHSLDEYFAHLQWLYIIDKTFIMLPLDETPFVIDANKRTIANPKITVMQNDQNAEVVMFTIDRYFDYKDLDTADIYVQWTLPDGKTEGATMIEMKDLSVPGKIRFGWPLDNEITSQEGTVRFSVRFWNVADVVDQFGNEEKNKVVYSLNTLTSTLTINKSLQAEIQLGEDANINAPIANGFFQKAIRNSQMYYQNSAIPQVPNFDAPGLNLNQYESLSTVTVGEDEISTLTLMAQAINADTGVISYEWWYCPAEDAEIDGQKFVAGAWYPYNATEELPGFSAFGGTVDHNVFKEIALAEDDLPVVGEIYYKEDADGNKIVYDYQLPRPEKLYERFTTYTVPADEEVHVTGVYKVVAKNTIDDNTSFGKDSQWCNLVSPQDVVFVVNGDLPERYIITEENHTLEVKVKDDENVKTQRTYTWSRKSKNKDAEVADEVINGESTLEVTQPGWYEVEVKSVLNREVKTLDSRVCKVTAPAAAPAREPEEEGAEMPMFVMKYGDLTGASQETGSTIPQFLGLKDHEFTLNVEVEKHYPSEEVNEELYTEGLTYEWYVHVMDEMEKVLLTENYPSVVGGLGTGNLTIRILEDDIKYTYTCVVVNHLNGEKAACDWTEALSFAVQ